MLIVTYLVLLKFLVNFGLLLRSCFLNAVYSFLEILEETETTFVSVPFFPCCSCLFPRARHFCDNLFPIGTSFAISCLFIFPSDICFTIELFLHSDFMSCFHTMFHLYLFIMTFNFISIFHFFVKTDQNFFWYMCRQEIIA